MGKINYETEFPFSETPLDENKNTYEMKTELATLLTNFLTF